MQTLPAIEGLTPTVLWITLFGAVCIGSLIVLGDKVAEVFRKRRERKSNQDARRDGTIQGQLDQISLKLDSIDEFMKETNRRFERDKRRLDALEGQSDSIQNGLYVLCRSSLAHLNHDITGNHVEALKAARDEITEYLTPKSRKEKRDE